MYEALRAKHYKVHYTEFSGGHDYINWQGMLAEGLMALLG
jgi:enterochelin esterase family protein